MHDEERALFDEFCIAQSLTANEALRRLARSAALLGPAFSGETRAEIIELSRQMRVISNNLLVVSALHAPLFVRDHSRRGVDD
jgi:hypothetical protein